MRIIAAIIITLFLLTGTAEAKTSCNPWKVADHFGTYEGGPVKFKAKYDLNGDGAVTVGDIILATNCWEERHARR